MHKFIVFRRKRRGIYPKRLKLWDNLAKDWKLDFQNIETKIVGLNEIHLSIENILKGQITGRVVLKHSHTI